VWQELGRRRVCAPYGAGHVPPALLLNIRDVMFVSGQPLRFIRELSTKGMKPQCCSQAAEAQQED
jgi:hypothetical protein